MRIDFGDWELTGRELALISAFLLAVFGCGCGLTHCIRTRDALDDYRYTQALGIGKDNSVFRQAMVTDAGDAFVSADFETVDPVSEQHLDGVWLHIDCTYQEEERVARHYTDKDGHTHTYHTWEWRTKRTWERNATRINCNSIEFPTHTFDYASIGKCEFVKKFENNSWFHFNTRDKRIIFRCIKPNFSGAFFTTFEDKQPKGENTIHEGKTHEELRKHMTTHYGVELTWFMLITAALAISITFAVKNDQF